MQFDWSADWSYGVNEFPVGTKFWAFKWDESTKQFDFVPPCELTVVDHREDYGAFGCIVAESKCGSRFNIIGFNASSGRKVKAYEHWFGFDGERECKGLYNKFVAAKRMTIKKDMEYYRILLDKVQFV